MKTIAECLVDEIVNWVNGFRKHDGQRGAFWLSHIAYISAYIPWIAEDLGRTMAIVMDSRQAVLHTALHHPSFGFGWSWASRRFLFKFFRTQLFDFGFKECWEGHPDARQDVMDS